MTHPLHLQPEFKHLLFIIYFKISKLFFFPLFPHSYMRWKSRKRDNRRITTLQLRIRIRRRQVCNYYYHLSLPFSSFLSLTTFPLCNFYYNPVFHSSYYVSLVKKYRFPSSKISLNSPMLFDSMLNFFKHFFPWTTYSLVFSMPQLSAFQVS